MNHVTDSFQYHGSLEENPIPEVLKKIGDYRVPGVLTVQQASVEKNVYIKEGRIVFATSNRESDRLGSFLVRQGIIDDATLEEANRRYRQERTKRLGRILVEMGALTPHQLFLAVRDQVQEIALSIFAWEQGTLRFVIGDYKAQELIKLHLPIRQAIMLGVRRMPNADRLVETLGGLNAYLAMTPQLRLELHELALQPIERSLLPLLDGQRTLRQILHESPLDRDLTVRLLYGLHVLERLRSADRVIRIRISLPFNAING